MSNPVSYTAFSEGPIRLDGSSSSGSRQSIENFFVQMGMKNDRLLDRPLDQLQHEVGSFIGTNPAYRASAAPTSPVGSLEPHEDWRTPPFSALSEHGEGL